MTLYWRIQALWAVVMAGVVIAIQIYTPLMASTDRPRTAAVVSTVVIAILILGGVFLQQLILRRASRRYQAALECDDLATAQGELDQFAAALRRSPKGRVFVDINRTVLQCARGQFADALAMASSIEPALVTPRVEAVYLNNLSWCHLQNGDLEKAEDLGTEALAKAADDEVRAACRGTLGAVFAVKGESDRALALLSESIASGHGGAVATAIRNFYKGVAFDSASQTEDARVAYRAAMAAAPESWFGRKAAERIP